MFDNTVTRYAKGLNSSTDQGIFSDLFVQERIAKIHEYPWDFDQYVAGDWTQQLNGGTIALVAGDGGILALTSAVSAITSQEKAPANFQLARGFRAWYQTQLAVDAVLGLVLAGLMNATATPFTAGSQTDGVLFITDNTGALSVVVAVGGVRLVTAMGVSLVAAQQAKLSFYYDGGVYAAAPNGRVIWEATGTSANARGSVPIPASGTIAAFPGAVNLGPAMGVSASTAVARVLSVDNVYVAKDRANINATPAF
jgi:hypothetical protein